MPGTFALALITLTTQGPIADDPKVAGRMRVGDVNTRIGIEVRGHSSQAFPKQQYGVESRDRRGDNRDVSALGLPASDDWVLSAPYSDKALLRNALAYRTAARMGHYAPRTRLVELRLNGDYRGVYVLTERPKLGDGRLPETENGFLLELTFKSQAIGEQYFTVPQADRPIIWLDPDREDLKKREARRVKRQVRRTERVLGSRRWTRRIAPRPTIDFVLVQELLKNQDAFHGSTYFHRAADRRIAFGPVWDFDLSMGNVVPGGRVGGTAGWLTRTRTWSQRLWRAPGFERRLANRWRALRRDGFRRQVLGDLHSMRRSLARSGAARRNFERWPILGRYVWPNPVDPATGTYRRTWKAEVDFARGFLVKRFRWMDRAVRRLP